MKQKWFALPFSAKRRAVLSVLIAVGTILSFASCAGRTVTGARTAGELNYHPSISAPELFMDEELWLCNRFSSVGAPPFSLPEAEEYPNGTYRYSFTGVPRRYYNDFLSGSEAEGFSHRAMKYSDFLFREDCMIFSQFDEDRGIFSVSWYQRSPHAPRDGISWEEAAELLMPEREDSLSRIPLHPIDITPEGFYERIGGQIFACPYYSFDVYKSSGREDLLFDANEWYSCSVCCVLGKDVYISSLERIAVCDVDGDGGKDVLLLSYGPTSGVFTFGVTCVTGRGAYTTLFATEYYALGFSTRDGRIVVEGVGFDSVHHYFDVSFEESGGEKRVMLSENGQRLHP